MATDDLRKEIEEAIRASVSRRFTTTVEDVSLVTQPSVSILIKIEHQGPEERNFDQSIIAHVRKLVSLFNVDQPKIIIQRAESNLPSPLIILQTMKILSPTSAEKLASALRTGGYVLVTDDWVQLRLDAFRKQRFVIRRDDATYVLTFHGLVKLGSQRDGRSTDVRRALEMARWKD